MALMRAFSKVDDRGRIVIPGNVLRQVELKPGHMVEVKVVGASKVKHVLVSKREAAR